MSGAQEAARAVLITGAARRVGAEMARTLHAAGMDIVIHYRASAADAEALARELGAARPGSCALVRGDLLSMEGIEALAREATAAFGRLDALVNNASSFYPTPLATATEAHWHDLIGSNLKAPFFLAQALAPELRRRHGGLINITDIHAERPLRDYPIYSAAKAGLIALTRALARDLAPEVRVNAISPGTILWPEHEAREETRAAILARIPLKRMGEPRDIARTALFLLRDAPYITGQVIAVDGGRSVVM